MKRIEVQRLRRGFRCLRLESSARGCQLPAAGFRDVSATEAGLYLPHLWGRCRRWRGLPLKSLPLYEPESPASRGIPSGTLPPLTRSPSPLKRGGLVPLAPQANQLSWLLAANSWKPPPVRTAPSHTPLGPQGLDPWPPDPATSHQPPARCFPRPRSRSHLH